MDGSSKSTRKPNPRENAFPLSSATFCYTIPTLLEGFKRELNESDLTETLTEHKSSRLGDIMERCWKEEERKATQKKSSTSLFKVLTKVFGWELMFYGLVLFISETVRMAQPIFLGKLLRFYLPNEKEISQEEAYWYAAGVVFCSLTNSLLIHPYMMGVLHLGMKLRVACCSLIYRKALKLSRTALGQTTAGQVVNLLSNDVNRFDVGVIFAHYLWMGPLETILCTYLMYLQVGVSAVIGVILLIVFIPMQIYLGKRISVLRLKTALRTDERVRLMNEIISGIQVIKMYAWEKPFAKLVDSVRRSLMHRRPKRSLECKDSPNECCRESLYVSFAEIGWNDWIIKPEGYNAFFCRGSCTTPTAILNSASTHNSILQKVMGRNNQRGSRPELTPCCAATQFQPLQLIYMDSNKTLTTKLLSNMIVETCGCM